MKSSGSGLLGLSANLSLWSPLISPETQAMQTPKSIIGSYGIWASQLASDPASLSFRNERFTNLESWKLQARQQTDHCIAAPELDPSLTVREIASYTFDGIQVEELEWSLPYGNPTRALLLHPSGAGPWPGILALHDHGGNKYLGWRKIARSNKAVPDFIKEHQDHYYGGVAWANELAKMGYAVLVHDAFTFGSRRVLPENVEGIEWGMPEIPPFNPDKEDLNYISGYNNWAAAHEHVLSKSLFCAGTTWPGVFLKEDQIALDILSNRSEVDANNLGCCGLSGGGLRTVYLGGLDDRIKCAIAVGFMSTWNDFLLYKSYTHTWMLYAPLLPNYLDFPEILGLRTPLPTMVLNNREDQLFTLEEMETSDKILKEVFVKAGASEKYQCNFYNGPHKFDQEMQQDAFQWFNRWLKN